MLLVLTGNSWDIRFCRLISSSRMLAICHLAL